MTRRWDAWVAVTGLVLCTAWTVYRIATGSADPGNYYQFRHSDIGFTYPTADVVTWSSGLVVETLFASVYITRTKRVALACLLLGITMIALLFAFGIFAMHAPPYMGGAIAFQLIGGAWLLIAALVSAIARARSR